ncbi:HD-GYP domain-containing protein [Alkaliphilus serpentinus]|uniref:HD-GYP domain-containing protein n=1 Tax=Alkaliphilus serpentinus TaxID=1482731 RepID=A0A833M869_9FIRM|nr:HD-GYP domain-containing protein [Alkaliphilus serpentinus]KAB3532083.1 HD-GYP domain-containing protein [Alkaliphilus serpentinus]
MNQLPKKARYYVLFIITLAVVLLISLAYFYDLPSIDTFFMFIILAILVESLAVLLPNGGSVSVGSAVDITVMIILGPLGAAICSFFGITLKYLKVSNKEVHHIANTPIYITLFNGAQSLLSIGIASFVYYNFDTKSSDPLFYTNILPLFIAMLTYILVNTYIVTQLFSLLQEQSFFKMFVNNFKWTLPNSFVISSLGIFISLLYLNYGTIIMLLFFGPLLLARYSFKMYIDTKTLYMETVYALTKAMEAKDPYTNGHSRRVADVSVKLATFMGLPQHRIETLKTAALLHDIGKIGIEDSILNKPGRLTELEMSKIRCHPVIGSNILNDVDFLKNEREIIYSHHERYDGKGYPDGVVGDKIIIEAAILSVADAFDAMTSDRSYRKGMTIQQALTIIKEEACQQFHPLAAESFYNMVQTQGIDELTLNFSDSPV